MHKVTYTLLALVVCLIACNSKNNQSNPANSQTASPKTEPAEKSVKGNWSNNDRQEFLKGCMGSALNSYRERNLPADSAAIINICTCMGKSLEEKYSYDDANKLDRETIKQETLKAAQNCK